MAAENHLPDLSTLYQEVEGVSDSATYHATCEVAGCEETFSVTIWRDEAGDHVARVRDEE